MSGEAKRCKREPMRVTVQRLRAENELLVRGLNAYRDAYRCSRDQCRGGSCGCRIHTWEREFRVFVTTLAHYFVTTKTTP